MTLHPLRSVGARIAWVVVIIVVAVVAFQVAYFPARLSATSERALDDKARAVAELVARTVAAGLEFDDQTMVDSVFEGVRSDDDVLYIVLFRANGDVMTGVHAELGPKTAPATTELRTQIDGGVLRVEVPVQSSLGAPGKLTIGYALEHIRAEQAQNLYATLFSGGVVVLLGLATAIALARVIGHPMRELAEVARHVAEGRLDVSPPTLRSDDEIGKMAESFRTMLGTLRALEGHVDRVSKGDLTRDADASGDLAAAFNRMVASQRELVRQIAETATDIRVTSNQILAASRELEQTATEQASVVEETLRTMESLLQSASQVSEASGKVLTNAEHTHVNSRMIAERITALAGHTQRIGAFLEVIKDIANKTDILALNAALEGTRAGEAGRGFSLVASQMQRLTVSVMNSVEDIKTLTTDIREATTGSVLATEDATKRALSTEQSARQISLIIQQQKTGTEQVTHSMGEISEAIRQSVAASGESTSAAAQLEQLSERLQQRVNRFTVST